MFRKLTAATLLWLMTLVVATSQPGLRYCLCLHEVYLSGCTCANMPDGESCPHADRSSEDSSKSFSASDSDHLSLLDCSCEDCSVSLAVDGNDYILTDHLSAHDFRDHAASKSFPANLEVVSPLQLRTSIHGIRGSPPRPGLIPSVPHRLRFSVFRV